MGKTRRPTGRSASAPYAIEKKSAPALRSRSVSIDESGDVRMSGVTDDESSVEFHVIIAKEGKWRLVSHGEKFECKSTEDKDFNQDNYIDRAKCDGFHPAHHHEELKRLRDEEGVEDFFKRIKVVRWAKYIHRGKSQTTCFIEYSKDGDTSEYQCSRSKLVTLLGKRRVDSMEERHSESFELPKTPEPPIKPCRQSRTYQSRNNDSPASNGDVESNGDGEYGDGKSQIKDESDVSSVEPARRNTKGAQFEFKRPQARPSALTTSLLNAEESTKTHPAGAQSYLILGIDQRYHAQHQNNKQCLIQNKSTKEYEFRRWGTIEKGVVSGKSTYIDGNHQCGLHPQADKFWIEQVKGHGGLKGIEYKVVGAAHFFSASGTTVSVTVLFRPKNEPEREQLQRQRKTSGYDYKGPVRCSYWTFRDAKGNVDRVYDILSKRDGGLHAIAMLKRGQSKPRRQIRSLSRGFSVVYTPELDASGTMTSFKSSTNAKLEALETKLQALETKLDDTEYAMDNVERKFQSMKRSITPAIHDRTSTSVEDHVRRSRRLR
ncbi:hypothetical protein BS50DRAFT_595147 [Corynespora cassiicola Philippines]|uniref:Uncharacterized protein n=1 Tax=Corynespora cassiicola Philippines TaxID=1448308 RepID=A0A2T2N064_CORCC|nr:hypothetical protein BS50DRAFT_595147 [Corynespora cassiicola Philippines]